MARSMLLFVLWIALLCVGCSHETLIRTSEVSPPSWQLTPPPPTEDMRFYVGRSIAVNILDQARGINSAKEDAAMQIAADAGSFLTAESYNLVTMEGEPIRGEETVQSSQKKEVKIDVKAIVSGTQQKGAYWEKWSVRERFLGSEFDRYEYWVLVSIPVREVERLRETLMDRIEVLLGEAGRAVEKGLLAEARTTLQRATMRYPASEEAWSAMARVCEQLGEECLPEAEKAYAMLEKVSSSPVIREYARVGLSRLRERSALVLIKEAENFASHEEWGRALESLSNVYRLAADDRGIGDRALERYYRYVSMEAAGKVKIEEGSIGILSTDDPRARNLRDAIGSVVQGRGTVGLVPRSAESTLVRGRLDALSSEARDILRRAGNVVLFVGIDGDALVTYRLNPTASAMQPLSRRKVLDQVPVQPMHPAWGGLPAKSSTDIGFRVHVWTDRRKYTIDDRIVYRVQATRDCYITLVELQTDGSMVILLPNRYQSSSLKAGQEVTVLEGAVISAKGPPGNEGVRAIGALKPFDVGPPPGKDFEVIGDAQGQRGLCERIATALDKLTEDQWDTSDWTFEICP